MSNYITTAALHHEKNPSDSHYPFSLTIFNQTRQMRFETDRHLLRCIVCIDLDMMRAGIVEPPKDMPHGGYIEIQRPRQKKIQIDYGALAHFGSYNDCENFWIETALSENQIKRNESWTQSIAIGNRSYVESVKRQIGSDAIGRKICELSKGFELREPESVYNALF